MMRPEDLLARRTAPPTAAGGDAPAVARLRAKMG
jgi:hypothetical protein